ncbi:MAG: hypothetical protein Q6352_012215 [Candidatus Freyrarchaeum guaymaensis]|nr:hypothetical protein [Candidatus Sigynarchaeota archaeon]
MPAIRRDGACFVDRGSIGRRKQEIWSSILPTFPKHKQVTGAWRSKLICGCSWNSFPKRLVGSDTGE